jgi:hypothetical protein
MQMNVPNSGPSGLPGRLTNMSLDEAADLQSLFTGSVGRGWTACYSDKAG